MRKQREKPRTGDEILKVDVNSRMTTMRMMTVAALAFGVCAAPQVAAAQTMQWTDKGYVSVNGGVQAGSHNLDTSSTFRLYDEDAVVSSTQKVKSGGLFDIGGAYRVWGHNLLAGVTYSRTSSTSDVAISGSIPDPVKFDSPRTVTTSQTGAKHVENAIHLAAIWMMPVAEKLDVGVFAGPSIFNINQDTVGTLTVTEPTPSVTAPLVKVSKTTVGINLGADVQYMLTKKWGVGGLARYSWGSAEIASGSKKLTVGGFQLAGGARMRF
jgi:hypothetical protein